MSGSFKYSFVPAAVFFSFTLCAAILLQTPALLALPFAMLVIFYASETLSAIWYVLLVLLPLSFEYQFNPSLGLDVPDEVLMIFLTICFFLLVSLKKIRLPEAMINHPVFFLLTASLFWALVCTVFSSNWLISLKYVLAKSWFLIPFTIIPWFILTGKKEFRIVALCIGGSMFFAVLSSLIRHGQNGFLFDTANAAVAPFFRNHVNYAAMLVCILPIAGSAYYLSKKKKHKQWLLAAMLVLLFALFFSYSRGAWLALIIGILSVFLIQKKILRFGFLFVLGAIGILLLLISKDNRYLNYHSNYKKTIYHANFKDHMRATFAGTDMSNAERFNRWIAALHMKNTHPVTGFGPNTFYDNYKPYMVSYFKTWVSENKEKSTVHNYFLLLLVEQGWVGLVLFIILLWFSFQRIEYLYATIKDRFYKTITLCIGVLLSMILTLNMLSDLIETDKIGSLFYLCLGVILWLDLQYKNKALQ